MKLIVPFVIILVFVLGVFSFINKDSLLNKNTKISITPASSASITPLTTDRNELLAGGSSFSDPNGIYSILYPNDWILDTSDSIHIRIYKQGPTQKGQTEMYDGAIMVFESISLGDKTLNEFVDNKIKEATQDNTSEITEAKKSLTINNYPAFTYSARGLGESKNYILQKNSTSKFALIITTLVSDPTNLGFQRKVDEVITNIKLLK